jgi:hypothetical protein
VVDIPLHVPVSPVVLHPAQQPGHCDQQVKADLHLSQFQVFVMLTSFQIMYTVLQIPLPLLGYLSGRGEWNFIFAIAASCSLVAAALWMLVNVDQRFVPPAAAAAATA